MPELFINLGKRLNDSHFRNRTFPLINYKFRGNLWILKLEKIQVLTEVYSPFSRIYSM